MAPVLILGMHRSGTSCLAGSLERAGLYLGEVNRQAPFNARGNCENRAIMELNDAVLVANGGAWDAPPVQVKWSEELRKRRDALIASYPPDQAWGMKDPRTLLTLAGWLEALPLARLVASFRHPAAVADSLAARNGFSLAQGYGLWLTYNQRLFELYPRLAGIVCFDTSEDAYFAQVEALARKLALPHPERAREFFAPELRHRQASANTQLPEEVKWHYDKWMKLIQAS